MKDGYYTHEARKYNKYKNISKYLNFGPFFKNNKHVAYAYVMGHIEGYNLYLNRVSVEDFEKVINEEIK